MRASFLRSLTPGLDGDPDLGWEFELAERLGMTVRRLRSEMSAFEMSQWRARDRALAKVRQQQKNKGDVSSAVRGRRRR